MRGYKAALRQGKALLRGVEPREPRRPPSLPSAPLLSPLPSPLSSASLVKPGAERRPGLAPRMRRRVPARPPVRKRQLRVGGAAAEAARPRRPPGRCLLLPARGAGCVSARWGAPGRGSAGCGRAACAWRPASARVSPHLPGPGSRPPPPPPATRPGPAAPVSRAASAPAALGSRPLLCAAAAPPLLRLPRPGPRAGWGRGTPGGRRPVSPLGAWPARGFSPAPAALALAPPGVEGASSELGGRRRCVPGCDPRGVGSS